MLVVLHGLTVPLGHEKGGPFCWTGRLAHGIPNLCHVEGKHTNAWN